MIELTVALPMWKSKHIGWLPLESLIRQKDIDFEWELIVAEEQNIEMFGKAAVMAYKDQLKQVGCVSVRYASVKKWIPLAQKWKLIGQLASETSKVFLCQAADNYSQPYRIKEAHQHIVDQNYDYICYPYSIFYSIPTHEVYLRGFSKEYKAGKEAKGMHYSFKTQYATALPKSNKRKVIDKWIYETVKIIAFRTTTQYKYSFVESPHWKKGFNSHGFHTLSLSRYKKWKKETVPRDLKSYLKNWPKPVMKRLQQLKGLSKK